MSSIIYGGIDFSSVCSAKVVGRSAHTLNVESVRVPGRAGAIPFGTWIPPEDVRVRLFLDPGFDPGPVGVAAMRHTLYSWLCRPDGGTLILPDEPELEYRDALLTQAGEWTQLFVDGECEVVFTLFDPVAYGLSRIRRSAGEFEVKGAWPTLPLFLLEAESGSLVGVSDGEGHAIAVERGFSGGESVVIDCACERIEVDGVDARADVLLGSDFFALAPGASLLEFSGCRQIKVQYRERWV